MRWESLATSSDVEQLLRTTTSFVSFSLIQLRNSSEEMITQGVSIVFHTVELNWTEIFRRFVLSFEFFQRFLLKKSFVRSFDQTQRVNLNEEKILVRSLSESIWTSSLETIISQGYLSSINEDEFINKIFIDSHGFIFRNVHSILYLVRISSKKFVDFSFDFDLRLDTLLFSSYFQSLDSLSGNDFFKREDEVNRSQNLFDQCFFLGSIVDF